MSGKQTLDRLKKPDKVIPDTHREFLDMDTDEEDFGRQETPEAEEESLPEPERPVYKNEELNILVQYIKELLVFPFVKESDWNEPCYEIIREYFCNPAHDVLSIFYLNGRLTPTLDIPMSTASGFAYFLRPHWHIFTPDNFQYTVCYGTINANVNKCVLKFMENVYAPFILNYQSWPEIIQNLLFSNLNEFLVHFMELIYKSVGVTMLYVPRERGLGSMISNKPCVLKRIESVPDEEYEKQRAFSTRLENVVYHWIRQIRCITRSVPVRNNITNLPTEVNFWVAKRLNLQNLHSQLLSSDVRAIIEILLHFRSPTVELFDELITRLKSSIEEASSNLSYLNILAEYSKDINVLENAESSIVKCLIVILFIWAESPYYKTTSNIEILCRTLGAQITNQCISHIDLNDIFGSERERGIATLEKCIECCTAYRLLYSTLTTEVASHINPNKKWNVREDVIFNNVDTFIQRCRDVMDISKMLILYGRCNKTMLLGTPKNTEYEVYCRKMESIFNNSLSNITLSRTSMFDVTDSTWLKKIERFKHNISQLENMTKNFIINIFSRVQNIEEGIEVLYAFSKYKNVDCLRDLLARKWTEIWKLFRKEIQFCYMTATSLTRRNNVLTSTGSISQYLQHQHDIMINASYWLGSSTAETHILQEYKRVIKTLNPRQDKLTSSANYLE